MGDGTHIKIRQYFDPMEVLYLCAVAVLVFTLVLDQTMWSAAADGMENQFFLQVTRYLRYVAYLVCAVKFLFSRHLTRRVALTAAAVAILLGVSMLYSSSRTVFLCLWVVLGARDVSARKIIRVTAWTQGVALFLAVFCSQVGIIQDYLFTSGDRLRHGLGLTWATRPPILFLFLVLQILYLRKFWLRIWEFAVLMAINVWMYVMTDTRTTFFMLTAILLFSLVYSRTHFKRLRLERVKYLFILAPEILAAFSIWLHAAYSETSGFWVSLNSLLSGRLALGHAALQTYGVNWFGNPITWIGYSARVTPGQEGLAYNYVDCSYVQFLLSYGVIVLAIVLAAYSAMMVRAIREGQYASCWILLFVLLLAVTEPRLVNLAFNPFVLLILAGDTAFSGVPHRNWIRPFAGRGTEMLGGRRLVITCCRPAGPMVKRNIRLTPTRTTDLSAARVKIRFIFER